jgi:hypothetical protein
MQKQDRHCLCAAEKPAVGNSLPDGNLPTICFHKSTTAKTKIKIADYPHVGILDAFNADKGT